MANPPVSGNTHLHRYEIHKRVATRLRRDAGVTAVDSDPSPMRPVRLVATLDRVSFCDPDLDAGDATLEFEWRPQPDRDEFRIQYTEPGRPWACGWHQDETHDDLGPSHFQVDHNEWATPHPEPAAFEDSNPMAILETCLTKLSERVPDLPESVRPDP